MGRRKRHRRGKYTPTVNGVLARCRFWGCGGMPSVTPQVFKNGLVHYRSTCSVCGRFQGWVPHKVEEESSKDIPY